ncbi:MAG: hypothetical protein LBJ58_05800 [Tannerellaceae bacterium]|jgi:hypothetical protein|nr:hypothetical protein [Tannerellaceae bacterium]
MEDKDDVSGHIRNSLNKIEGRFHLLEQSVPIESQLEYFRYSEQMRKTRTEMTDDEYDTYNRSLSGNALSTEHKKYILSALATSNDVRAYRLLEEYVQNPDPDVADWSYMALMESRLSLESELLEERQIYISTGLGGKGEKLRFCVLLTASGEEPFQQYQRQTIEREFDYTLHTEDCEIERIAIHDLYVKLLILVPVRKDIKAILEKVVTECNQYGNFISGLVTITNMKEISAAEIEEIIRKNHGNKNHGNKNTEAGR